MRDPSQREPERESYRALALVDRYVTRWRNSQEAVASVTIAIRASGQRSGSSRSSPAPSRYTALGNVDRVPQRIDQREVLQGLGHAADRRGQPDKRANGIITRNE